MSGNYVLRTGVNGTATFRIPLVTIMTKYFIDGTTETSVLEINDEGTAPQEVSLTDCWVIGNQVGVLPNKKVLRNPGV